MSSVGREFERSKMIGGIGAILTVISFHNAFLLNPLGILLSFGVPFSAWNIVLFLSIWSISITGV